MRAINFQALVVAISLLGGLISSVDAGRCPAAVYSVILDKTLDVFSISNAPKKDLCVVKFTNSLNSAENPDERCRSLLPGSFYVYIYDNPNFWPPNDYFHCEIQPDEHGNFGALPVDGAEETKPAPSEAEMDAFLKQCNIEKKKSVQECTKIRMDLIERLGGRDRAQRVLKSRKAMLIASKINHTLIFGGAGTVVGILLIILVAYAVLAGKKSRRKGQDESTTADETSTNNVNPTTTEAEPSKKKKKKRSMAAPSIMSKASMMSKASTVSKSVKSKNTYSRNVDSDEDQRRKKRRRKRKRRRR